MPDDKTLPAGGDGWLAKAEDDLRVARAVLGGDIGVEWAACFHAQQAAEKALKGLLVHLGVDFPKSHSLDRLVAFDAGRGRRTIRSRRPYQFDSVGVVGRYPEDIANPTAEQARGIVDSAADIVESARAATRET